MRTVQLRERLTRMVPVGPLFPVSPVAPAGAGMLQVALQVAPSGTDSA